MMKNKEEKKKEKKKSSEFEYCVVCKLNHDQGQRHKYFPNHKTALSKFLARFQIKIDDVRFFLKNPCVLCPEYASGNRLWCVFCDADIDELGSSYACANAISHLASADHLKNLKHFLWKHGGGMDRVDIFRISVADVDKWERKCQSLKNEAALSCEGPRRSLIGPSNDIHNENKFDNVDNFQNNAFQLLNSNLSNGVVMPLQYNTNEYQVSYSGPYEANMGTYAVYSFPAETCPGTSSRNVNNLTGNSNSQHSLLDNSGGCLENGHDGGGRRHQVYQDGRMVIRDSSYPGLQSLTQVSSLAPQKDEGNVHSGAPPPWLEAAEPSQLNVQLNPSSSKFVSSSHQSSKSRKLNPKRVGAAWAERRKMEMEMEKRGEVVRSDYDTAWLPNFGRVWQSGSRKESRKEFEAEKPKLPNVESHAEMPMKIQPYISKRMRRDADE